MAPGIEQVIAVMVRDDLHLRIGARPAETSTQAMSNTVKFEAASTLATVTGHFRARKPRFRAVQRGAGWRLAPAGLQSLVLGQKQIR